MIAACGKRKLYECVACNCLKFSLFLVTAFVMAIDFLMVVMTISFAPPIDLYKSLWKSESGYFTKILF